MDQALIQRIRDINAGVDIKDMPLSVVDYARVSTVRPEQKSSFQNQLETYREIIKSNPNWTYRGTYSDEGKTGTKISVRGGLLQMVEDAKAGRFDLILVKSISRFARNLKESLMIKDELKAAGVMIYFYEYQLNTFRDRDEQMFKFLSLSADMESVAARDRTKMVFQQKIQSGAIYGNSKILGYRKEHCKLVIDENEAKAVRLIFDLYVNQHMGLRRIAGALAERGCLRKDGTQIPTRTIGTVLENPKYKGWYCGGKTAVYNGGRYRKTVLLDQNEWVMYKSDEIPAIVSEELWNAAAAIRKEKTSLFDNQVKMPVNQGLYPYSGLIEHEERPGIHYVHVNYTYKGKRRDGWQCRNYRDNKDAHNIGPTLYSDELDSIVRLVLREFMSNSDMIVEDLLQIYEGIAMAKMSPSREKELRSKNAALEMKITRLVDLYTDGSINKQQFTEKNDAYKRERAGIQNELKTIAAIADQKTEIARRLQAMREKIADAVVNVDISPELVRLLVERILVKSDSTKSSVNLEVTLRLLPKTEKFLIARKKCTGDLFMPSIQVINVDALL